MYSNNPFDYLAIVENSVIIWYITQGLSVSQIEYITKGKSSDISIQHVYYVLIAEPTLPWKATRNDDPVLAISKVQYYVATENDNICERLI